jgi:urease accessory protein
MVTATRTARIIAMTEVHASTPAALPNRQGNPAEPAALPNRQGNLAEPAALPDRQGNPAEPAALPDRQGSPAEPAALYRLLAWSSPGYPTGAFSYSHGLEWAVEAGSVTNLEGLLDYVTAVLSRGGGWVDAVLFVHAWRAASNSAASDSTELAHITELAAAFRGSSETALESRQQGAAFLDVTRKAWPHPTLDALAERASTDNTPVAHCIAVAAACAAHEIPLLPALYAYIHAIAANLVSAGARLIPLGQTQAQIAIAQLSSTIAEIIERAQATSLDDLGTAAPAVELCSLRHETQYTRLFRS